MKGGVWRVRIISLGNKFGENVKSSSDFGMKKPQQASLLDRQNIIYNYQTNQAELDNED